MALVEMLKAATPAAIWCWGAHRAALAVPVDRMVQAAESELSSSTKVEMVSVAPARAVIRSVAMAPVVLARAETRPAAIFMKATPWVARAAPAELALRAMPAAAATPPRLGV